jgi:uncharacterized protein
MAKAIGEVAALFRYPVKSMRGERIQAAAAGWHGLEGDRRLAVRRSNERGGFPWLTASRLPELLLFSPQRHGGGDAHDLPTHVCTPEAQPLPVYGNELAADIGRRHGAPVEMVHLNRGVFDEAAVSLITVETIDTVSARAALTPDVRRFRPNILISTSRSVPFEEDDWVGGVLSFGVADAGAAVFVTNRDERCAMVNYDPDSARPDVELLRSIVHARGNRAGVYSAVVRCGPLEVGQRIFFAPATGHRASR